MILTARDLRALLRHFELSDDGSQEDLLKRLKYFLINTDHLFGFETAKQMPMSSPQPQICEKYDKLNFVLPNVRSSDVRRQDDELLETQEDLKERDQVAPPRENLQSELMRGRGFKDRKPRVWLGWR